MGILSYKVGQNVRFQISNIGLNRKWHYVDISQEYKLFSDVAIFETDCKHYPCCCCMSNVRLKPVMDIIFNEVKSHITKTDERGVVDQRQDERVLVCSELNRRVHNPHILLQLQVVERRCNCINMT